MTGFLALHSDREKLRSYSAASKNGRHIVRIEIEVSDAIDLGYMLDSLAKYAAAQKQSKKSSGATPVPLMLTHQRSGS